MSKTMSDTEKEVLQEFIKKATRKVEQIEMEADVHPEDEIFRRDMEEARKEQRRHSEAIHKANQEVLSAINSAVGGMKAIEKEINPEVLTPEELVDLGNTLADLGKAVAAMRQSMNPPWMPGAYGYGCGTAIV